MTIRRMRSPEHRKILVPLGAGVVVLILWLIAFLLFGAVRTGTAWLLVALTVSFTVGTTALGIAVAAVLPPLPPISESSILGRRLVDFTKIGIAIAAFFGSITMSGIVSRDIGRADQLDDLWVTLGGVSQLLLTLGTGAAIIYLWWLPVDLFRAGARKRRGAINWLARAIEPRVGRTMSRSFKRIASYLLSEWWVVAFSFYLVPLIVLALATSVRGGLAAS